MTKTVIALLFVVGIIVLIFTSRGTTMDKQKTVSDNAEIKKEEVSSPAPTAGTGKSYSSYPKMTINSSKKYLVTLSTNKGIVKIDLFPGEAPLAVNNFVFLVREGFYNGTKFHRVIKDFMIQGGDPLGNGTGGPGYQFADDPVVRDYKRGTVAMANSGPDTNGSQFFIMHQDYALPKKYTIFGEVVEGMDVVDSIAQTEVVMSPSGEFSQPVEEIIITDSLVTES